MRALAVSPVVLGDGVGAGATPSPSAVVAGSAALGELCPLGPATIDCRGNITIYIYLHAYIILQMCVMCANLLLLYVTDSCIVRLTGAVVCVAVSDLNCQPRTVELSCVLGLALSCPALSPSST